MIYRLLADGVLVIHLAFILFVVLGGLLVFKWRRAAWVHLPMAGWGVAIEFFDWTCPLTPLEQYLRRVSGAMGYTGGFIEHYLVPIIYPGTLTRALQVGLGLSVVAFNVAVYAFWWRARARG